MRIPLGVDIPAEEDLECQRARRVLGIAASDFVILYIGRLSEYYKADLDFLLRAVANLSVPSRQVRLIVAGQDVGHYGAYVRGRGAVLGMATRLIVLENFADFLKSTLFAACDVYVSPADSIQETFGIAVLEAMAHGRPVVVPSWSGFRDIVIDGECGFLLKTIWSKEAGRAGSVSATMITSQRLAYYLAQRTVMDITELVRRLKQLADDPALARAMGDRGRRGQLRSLRGLLSLSDCLNSGMNRSG